MDARDEASSVEPSQTCVCECHNTTPSTRSTGKTAHILAKKLHAGTKKKRKQMTNTIRYSHSYGLRQSKQE